MLGQVAADRERGLNGPIRIGAAKARRSSRDSVDRHELEPLCVFAFLSGEAAVHTRLDDLFEDGGPDGIRDVLPTSLSAGIPNNALDHGVHPLQPVVSVQ